MCVEMEDSPEMVPLASVSQRTLAGYQLSEEQEPESLAHKILDLDRRVLESIAQSKTVAADLGEQLERVVLAEVSQVTLPELAPFHAEMQRIFTQPSDETFHGFARREGGVIDAGGASQRPTAEGMEERAEEQVAEMYELDSLEEDLPRNGYTLTNAQRCARWRKKRKAERMQAAKDLVTVSNVVGEGIHELFAQIAEEEESRRAKERVLTVWATRTATQSMDGCTRAIRESGEAVAAAMAASNRVVERTLREHTAAVGRQTEAMQALAASFQAAVRARQGKPPYMPAYGYMPPQQYLPPPPPAPGLGPQRHPAASVMQEREMEGAQAQLSGRFPKQACSMLEETDVEGREGAALDVSQEVD